MQKIKVDSISRKQNINVQVIKHRKNGHRISIGHSMFIHAKDFTKLMELAGRA